MRPIRRLTRSRTLGRILIVDDEPYWPNFLREILGAEAIELIHEPAEEGALAQLEKGHFDLIVLSASLPNHGALALLKALRHRSDLSDVAVVFAAGAPDWKEGRDAYEAGAVEYLAKSYDTKKITESFQRLLEWRRDRAATR